MRKAYFTFIFTVLSTNLKEAAAKTFSSSILSTTRSEVLEAVGNTPIPYDGIVDPNNILDQATKQKLSEKIYQHSSLLRVNRQGRVVVTSGRNGDCHDIKDSKSRSTDINNAGFPVQIVVTIVEGMEVVTEDEIDDNDLDVEELAGQFVMNLHNIWGVGHEIKPSNTDSSTENHNSGGTGVLVFLSVRDRVVFISVGGALDHLLTSGRIDRIIKDDMRADLKQANFGLGLVKGIDAIVELLENNEEPSLIEKMFENWDSIIIFLWTAFAFGIGSFRERKRQREQRVYAKVAAQLSELDRARAGVLQGSYQQTTSCPICFEKFLSTVHGSDGRPLQLLRCGHVFDKTCFEKWISLGYGDVTKCPVCRVDIGPSCDGPTTTPMPNNSLQWHTFAANTGSEDDIDLNDRNSTNNSSLQNVDIDRDLATIEFEDDSRNENSIPVEVHVRHDETRMNIQYRVDRIFRLERLSELYPRYITPDAVLRWCSPTFNGSLVKDQSFRNRKPVVTQNKNRCCSSTNSNNEDLSESSNYGEVYNFGGGTTAGGAGGSF